MLAVGECNTQLQHLTPAIRRSRRKVECTDRQTWATALKNKQDKKIKADTHMHFPIHQTSCVEKLQFVERCDWVLGSSRTSVHYPLNLALQHPISHTHAHTHHKYREPISNVKPSFHDVRMKEFFTNDCCRFACLPPSEYWFACGSAAEPWRPWTYNFYTVLHFNCMIILKGGLSLSFLLELEKESRRCMIHKTHTLLYQRGFKGFSTVIWPLSVNESGHLAQNNVKQQ